ncbi:MAG: hypothetical protein WBV39_01255 [Rudaea sp.]
MKRLKSTSKRHSSSRQIEARKTRDAQFLDILRGKCVRAAGIGALTAAAESIPGLGRVLGLVFGELLDANMLASVQRRLVEETFALYELNIPDSLHASVVANVQRVGVGAGVTGDLFLRGAMARALGRAGGLLARRTVPLTAVFSSALVNASVTYAIGKRAQAVAQAGDDSIKGMADVVRAFSGVDERRIYAWSMTAIKGSLSSIAETLRRMRRADDRS